MQTALGLLEEETRRVGGDRRLQLAQRAQPRRRLRPAGRRGAELVTTEMVAFEWLRDAGHPRFRDVLTIVK
jgi:hypothetical protein